MTIKPIESVRELHELKQRLNRDDMDFVPYESWLPTPFNLDPHVNINELSESEIEEHLRGTVYPELHIPIINKRKKGRKKERNVYNPKKQTLIVWNKIQEESAQNAGAKHLSQGLPSAKADVFNLISVRNAVTHSPINRMAA